VNNSAFDHNGTPAETTAPEGEAGSFYHLAETLPELLWTCMPDGKCDYFNARWTQFTGRAQQDLLGDRWRACMHPEDRDHTAGYWLAALKEEVPYDLEYRLRRADGVYHWFKVRAAPMRDEKCKVVKWFGICTDIQDIKDTEKNLRASDTWLRMLMHTVRDFAIFSVDTRNIIKEWNIGAEHTFGYEAREIIGQTADQLFLTQERETGIPEQELATARAEGVAMDERWHLRKNGERFFCQRGGAAHL